MSNYYGDDLPDDDEEDDQDEEDPETPLGPEWDDLNEVESAALGILSELQLIRMSLETLVEQNAANSSTDETSRPIYECRCGQELVGVAAAERHAVDEHNAPEDGTTWQQLFQGYEP